MSQKFDFTVAAIVEHDSRFLLVQERSARRIVLNQPAGHLENGESLVEAVVRETFEETGRRFTPQSITGVYQWEGPGGRSVIRVAFAGSAGESDESIALDRAIIRTLWLDRRQLAARVPEHRSPLVLRCVDDYLRGARHPLELLAMVPAATMAVAVSGS
ncbi:MAG: NUDIX hydrolase [Steroidobacteraceae bacterium]